MRNYKLYISLLAAFIFLFAGKCLCQAKDSTSLGIIKGIVIDSIGNSPLSEATIAIYNELNNELVDFTLTSENGSFISENLPLGLNLKLIVSFTGYRSVERQLQISKKGMIDLGNMTLTEKPGQLEDVIIKTIPPVRVNGDTLEFNADAFHLDPNAQVEDLLKKFPGVIIWADGLITVNGKKVETLLVNGKPFFGTDFRIATQNLPKVIVDKVQVYRKGVDSTQLRNDSTTEINIKLKHGKDLGYFGKTGFGYGPGKKYDLDGTLNYFNKRTQLGIGAINNNINKYIPNMNNLLSNNTFKDNRASTEFQTDFTIAGVNTNSSGGVLLQHDFGSPVVNTINRLNAEIYLISNNQISKEKNMTITNIANGNYLNQYDTNIVKNSKETQSLSSTYRTKSDTHELSLQMKFYRKKNGSQQHKITVLDDQSGSTLSTNNMESNTASKESNLSLSAIYNHSAGKGKHRNLLSNYKLSYNIERMDSRNDRYYATNYQSYKNDMEHIGIDRIYSEKSSEFKNTLTMSLPNITPFVFKKGLLSSVKIGLSNETQVTTHEESDNVKDKDSLALNYRINPYLTNQRQSQSINIKPDINFYKLLWHKFLGGDYREISANFSIGPNVYLFKNSSQNINQQIVRKYNNFDFKGGLNYEFARSNSASDHVSLNVANAYLYPTVQQLAPLVDSSNPNLIQIGNEFLRSQEQKRVEFLFIHDNLRLKNTFHYLMSISSGYTKDFITSNNRVDNLGKTTYIPANGQGHRYGSLRGEIRKTYKLKNSQFQLTFTPFLSLSKSPIYLNDSLYFFYNVLQSYEPAINYELVNKLVANFSLGYSRNLSKMIDNNMDISGQTFRTRLNINYNITKRLSLKSNLTYTTSKFTESVETRYSIWNVHMVYRFFRSHNAEVKFSALDILHENTDLVHFSSINSITQGQRSILQRYFMLTISWYPRRFGK